MIFIIYLTGCILAYIILKKANIFYEDNVEWEDVISRMLLSITSWFILIMILLYIIIEKLPKSKPPKWL